VSVAEQEQPLVSIVTAAYNAAAYLEETIESVLDQDYPRLEYIVLDDGSTDGTRELIERYDGRLTWDSHPNMGEARTVNKGLAMSHGDPVAVVSADDPLLPGIVSTMVEWLAARPEVLVAYPDWEMIDERGEVIQQIRTFDYSYRDMVRWHHCLPGPGAFIRRRVIDAVGGRDPHFRYVSDMDFWFQAGLYGPFSRVPKILARYRHHAAAASVSKTGALMAREHMEMTDKLFARTDLPWSVRRLRAEAFSSSHWIAGCVAGNSEPELRRRHWRSAFLYAPHKYFGEYREARFTPALASVVFDGRFRRPLVLAATQPRVFAGLVRGNAAQSWAHAKLYAGVIRAKVGRLPRA
jgi:glycosyltransferase involved in cell wall biosynthesis